jgi:hypothetical protein
MNRCLAFIGALILAFISISSACTAAPGQWIHFTLESRRGDDGRIHASFRKEVRDHDEYNWSSGFHPSELAGLDLAGFRAGGTRPLRFAIVREAGRLDCSGHGGEGYAAGNCSFTADAAFTQLLASRGIGRPSNDQAFGLMAVNARRELIDAVAAARYPTPSIDDLMGLSALGVDGGYIGGLAHLGYRPQTIHSLIEFKALGISPDWIGGFVRIGYANVPADELVQLKALDITPAYIAGFDRIGYRHLSVDKLVQLKALDVTPEFVSRIAAVDGGLPPVEKLVQLKALGRVR